MRLTLIILFVMMVGFVGAHQPRIASDGSINNPIIIEDPKISKAYYGELEGNPEYYQIKSERDFLLYVNILSPDVEGARTDFVVEVLSDSKILFVLNESNWKSFYEPFGGDDYLMGPEIEEQTSAGNYIIKVLNIDNYGKYSLAVGKIESFPPVEIIKTVFALPKIKRDFFGKSPLTAYFNYTGLFLLIFILIIASLIFMIRFLIKKYRGRR